MDRNKFPLDPRHLGVPSGASKTISEPMVRWCKQCIYLAPTLTLPPYGPKQDSTRPMSHRSSIGCTKMFSKPMACSAQTMHLSCVKIRTTSKWTKTSFHLSLVTKEYHRVRPKRFLSLSYIRCKPCTYLAPTLTLSRNGLKHDST